MRRRVGMALCALLLCGLVFPAAGNAKSSRHLSAKTSNLPAAATSAISAAMGRDQQAYHAAVVRKGYQMKNPRSGLQATFTRQGVRVKRGTANWGMALAALGASGRLHPVAMARPQAKQNRVEYRRGALTEWYVNGPAGLEQGFTIATAPAGSANGTIELALRLKGNLTASVDAAKTGLILKGRQTSLRYTGLAARDAKGRKLRSWLEVRKGRLLVQVAVAGASYPVVVDPYIQSAKLVASDGAAHDNLGISVSVSADGSTVVAGAGGAKVNSNANQGAAYVFTKSGSDWTQAAKLTASDGQAYDDLGFSVSVSANGSTVVAGAWRRGAAYVFTKSASNWTQAAKLMASDAPTYDTLGFSVSVSADGSTVVAGAVYAKVNSNLRQGAAYVFVKPSGGWADGIQATKLVASDGQANDKLGHSVSVSADGSTVAAGAPGGSSRPGAAYVFTKSGSDWTQVAKLTASDGVSGDYLGYSVSVSADGSTVVAGASQDLALPPRPGAAYVFTNPGSGWTEAAELTAWDGEQYDFLGDSVSVSGDGSTVVAGADGKGAVYVFVKPSGGWAGPSTHQHEAARLTALASGGLGLSVSMKADGLTVAAGAPGSAIKIDTEAGSVTNVGQGAAYVFSAAVPFASFDASKLRITLGPPSSFALNSSFILDQSSIDPLTESVTLIVGNLVMAIPAGSFQQQKNGNYVFSGVVEGVSLNAKFENLDANQWVFKANGSSPNALSIINPARVTLSIGNDTGAWTGTVPIN